MNVTHDVSRFETRPQDGNDPRRRENRAGFVAYRALSALEMGGEERPITAATHALTQPV